MQEPRRSTDATPRGAGRRLLPLLVLAVVTPACGVFITDRPGTTRYGTAAAVSTEAFPDGAEVALVATGEGFADALAAAPLAGTLAAPILLTAPDEVPDATADALDGLGVERVILLGGEDAVAAEVEDTLAREHDVSRRAGADRFETAAILAREAFPGGSEVALLAWGGGFADALAAAPLAAFHDAPVLLTDRHAVPQVTAQALDELGVADVILLGGPGVIGQPVQDDLAQRGLGVRRLAGADRYETAAIVAGRAFPGGSEVVLLATGEGFADVLAAAPLARSAGAPILLTAHGEVPAATMRALDELEAGEIVILGGSAAVADEVEVRLSDDREVRRHAGEA